MKANTSSSSDMYLRIHAELLNYRVALLLHNSKLIAGHNELRTTTLSIANGSKNKITFLNLFDVLTTLNECASTINNELRSYVQGASCSLLPIQLKFYGMQNS